MTSNLNEQWVEISEEKSGVEKDRPHNKGIQEETFVMTLEDTLSLM